MSMRAGILFTALLATALAALIFNLRPACAASPSRQTEQSAAPSSPTPPGAPISGDAGAKRVEETLKDAQGRARAEKLELLRLSREERGLSVELARQENWILELEEKLRGQEKVLSSLLAEETRLVREHGALEKERERASAELASLLGNLWPLHLAALRSRTGLDSWSEADREFSWLSEVYREVEAKRKRIDDQALAIAANLAERERVAAESREQLARVNRDKDAVLADKLAFLRKIQAIRARKLDQEEELGEILKTIDNLNYQLKSLASREIDTQQGKLPWPAQGARVVTRFAPDRTPPFRGVGLAVPDKAPVLAVSAGKVVHNDVLRGFGRVVILFHGKDYYSLYAFLEDTPLAVGQEVERGETVGRAGYYPEAKGSGLYFELRFRQKAINPELWLIASR